MIQVYDPEKHELLLLHWWLYLRADQEEFDKLFMKPLQSLTELMAWAKNTVKLGFDSDANGINMCAWVEPLMGGAALGVWGRKDKRHSKAGLHFMNQFYEAALQQFPVLIGVTKQPQLHRIHLRAGYEYVGEIPHLYDEVPGRLYVMTRESRNRIMKVKDEQPQHHNQL